MFGCTDLKAWMALCWKTVWKLDPLPLTVPESLVLAAVVGEPGAAVPGAAVVEELDLWELPQAVTKRASAQIAGRVVRTSRRREVIDRALFAVRV
jgi:hypothetical protein